MSFSFNFGGDDIEPDANESQGGPAQAVAASTAPTNGRPSPEVPPVVRHDIREWLSLLPSQLSYDTISLPSPSSSSPILLPRRSLFDIRAQLISEDSPSLAHLSSPSDLDRHIYEGGYKTWESSLDLACLLAGVRGDASPARVVELGCGSALPTLVMLRRALSSGEGMGIVCADYNAEVLRLVTLPNLLLVWALTVREGGSVEEGGGELDVDVELVDGFLAALGGREVRLVSGPWGEELSGEIGTGNGTLVLAAETIYSPESLDGFVGMLSGLLGGGKGMAYVAAKRFYFGVGGSVDAFMEACGKAGMVPSEIKDHGLAGMDEGVGRAVIKVQMR